MIEIKRAIHFTKLIDIKDSSSILMMGCSNESLINDILKEDIEILGIDLDEYMVSKARAKGVRAIITMAEMLQESDRFDIIFLDGERYPLFELNRAFKNIYNALKKDGIFIGELKLKNDSFNLDNLLLGEDIIKFGEFNEEEYINAIKESGLLVRKVTKIIRPVIIKDPKKLLKEKLKFNISHLDKKEQEKIINNLERKIKKGSFIHQKFLRVAAQKPPI